MMNKDDGLATLRAHEAELKRAGTVRLSVFGSVPRGETGNDVDLPGGCMRATPSVLGSLAKRLALPLAPMPARAIRVPKFCGFQVKPSRLLTIVSVSLAMASGALFSAEAVSAQPHFEVLHS